jgi:RNA recognition motif-containing protein
MYIFIYTGSFKKKSRSFNSSIDRVRIKNAPLPSTEEVIVNLVSSISKITSDEKLAEKTGAVVNAAHDLERHDKLLSISEDFVQKNSKSVRVSIDNSFRLSCMDGGVGIFIYIYVYIYVYIYICIFI